MKPCAIVGAGDFYPERFHRDEYGLVIAADGGYDSLTKIRVTPDLLIGDFDSILTEAKGIETLRFKVEKDETDMHLAYLEGVSRGYTEFHIFGGVGGRQDHTFANYSLLLHARLAGNRMVLHGDKYYSFVIKNERIELLGRCGGGLSVFAFGADAVGVTLSGLKYECSDATITPSFPLGVSNSFTAGPASIEVRDGALLVMAEY